MAMSRAVLVLAVVLATVAVAYGDVTEEEFDAFVAASGAKHEAALATPAADDFVGANSKSPPTPHSGCSRYVGTKGSGAKYTKIMAAVKSIPAGLTERCVIYVGEGQWVEKVLIDATYGPITLKGVSALKTIIKGDSTANSSGSTALSAIVAVLSNKFIAEDITFQNTHPAPAGGAVGEQAVAFRIEGDQAQFYRVAFLGAQDTLYDKAGRHYYKDCYIKGSIDFIFGAGRAYFERCNLVSFAQPWTGSLTAQKKMTKSELSGFVFNGCLVTGTGPIYLGRAWGIYSSVVFAYTNISVPIIPAGWFNWNDPKRQKTVFYGQYKCSGPGANTTGRVSWSKELTDKQAAPFLSWDYVDGKSWIGKV